MSSVLHRKYASLCSTCPAHSLVLSDKAFEDELPYTSNSDDHFELRLFGATIGYYANRMMSHSNPFTVET